MADHALTRIRLRIAWTWFPLPGTHFCCFAVSYRAAGLSCHVAENAEIEQVCAILHRCGSRSQM